MFVMLPTHSPAFTGNANRVCVKGRVRKKECGGNEQRAGGWVYAHIRARTHARTPAYMHTHAHLRTCTRAHALADTRACVCFWCYFWVPWPACDDGCHVPRVRVRVVCNQTCAVTVISTGSRGCTFKIHVGWNIVWMRSVVAVPAERIHAGSIDIERVLAH